MSEWPAVGKELLIRLSLLLFVLCLFVILDVSHFGFDLRDCGLITVIPGHCLPFT